VSRIHCFITRSSATAEIQRVSCPHEGGGGRPSSPIPSSPSGYTYAYGRIRNPQQTYVKRAVRKAHFQMNREFKDIQGHPYWCRQESRTVYCRNVQLMPTLFLKLMKMWQRENGKFVDFNDPTQVWRRPSKKRLRISTNDLQCQKLVIGLHFCRCMYGSAVCLHSNLCSGLQKTHLFCSRVRFGRSRSFRVIQGRWFGTNRKRVYDFLLVLYCDYSPILHRF